MPVAFLLPSSLGEQTAISRAAGVGPCAESERAVLASLQEVKSALSSRLPPANSGSIPGSGACGILPGNAWNEDTPSSESPVLQLRRRATPSHPLSL
jgi:hypothetical protein